MRLPRVRALRHGLLTSVAVLGVFVVLGVVNLRTVVAADTLLAPLTARAEATVTPTGSGRATVTFADAAGRPQTVQVDAVGAAPGASTVAYDPADPTRVALPSTPELVAADRATTDLAVLGFLALVVLAIGAQRVISRSRLRRTPAREASVRRVRQQNRLLSRSWVEVEGAVPVQRFPVYFDPALVTLDSPTRLLVHGSGPLRAIRIGEQWVYPSGRVGTREPRGQLIDNPAHPDAAARDRAARSAPLRRQLKLDGVLLAPAPFVGIFWVFLDGGGVTVWISATLVTAVLALWGAAVLGSDPS